MRKILQRNVLFVFLSLAMLSIVFLGCVHDSDDDDDTSSSGAYDTPLAVVNGTIKSADMSASGVSVSSAKYARLLSTASTRTQDSDKNKAYTEGAAAVAELTGENDIAPVVQILTHLSSNGSLTNASFNTLLTPTNSQLTVAVSDGEYTTTVEKIQINREQDGAVFYIYFHGSISFENDTMDMNFAVKCVVNLFGTLDTDFYFISDSNSFATDYAQIKQDSASSKKRFSYHLDENGTKEDFRIITITASGFEVYWKRQDYDDNKNPSRFFNITIASNRTYSGATEAENGASNAIKYFVLNDAGRVLCKKEGSSGTWADVGSSGVNDPTSIQNILVTRASTMVSSFPTTIENEPSEKSELKSKLESWQ